MVLDQANLDALLRLALALGLGALIGIERERHHVEKSVLAGIRTYPLVSLSGYLAVIIGLDLGEGAIIVAVGATAAAGFALSMYWVRQRQGILGLTSPISLFAAYFVGVLVGVGRDGEAIAAAVAITLLLFTKQRLHQLAHVLTPQEMEGALYFLVLGFILYPILPTEPIDPLGLLELRNALLLVLLVSLLSFVSFLALRRYGAKHGLPFSGLLGGLVNSEAATLSLARIHKARDDINESALAGILLANATMFVRNLVIVAIADPSLRLAQAILWPMIGASVVYALWALRSLRKESDEPVSLELKSPFAFRPAFVFAFWFTAIGIATVSLQRWAGIGEAGTYVAALGGLVSAGAVAASLGTLVTTGNASVPVAAQTVVLASLISAMGKVPIVRFATRNLARRLVAPTGVAVALAAGLILILL